MFVLSAINYSVINGHSEPIQVQVTDVKTCFDKMWLQSCTNGLYENGLRNNMLSLMHFENVNVHFAVKVNNWLTERTDAHNVEIQESVLSSLRCTSMMDTLNNIVMSDEDLQTVQLNRVINSFIETQRLTLSKEKKCCDSCG